MPSTTDLRVDMQAYVTAFGRMAEGIAKLAREFGEAAGKASAQLATLRINVPPDLARMLGARPPERRVDRARRLRLECWMRRRDRRARRKARR